MNEILNYGQNVASSVGILFILIFSGYLMGKFKILTKNGIGQLVNVLLYVVTPCVIVNSFLTVDYSKKNLNDLLISGGCAFLTHFVAILFSFVFFKEKSKAKQSVLRFGLIFSNASFMSIPLASELFGQQGVFYVSSYVIVFNLVTWTYGISLYKMGDKSHSESKVKAILNPGVVGVAIGLPLFFLSITLPKIIAQPIEYVASINTPLAMMVTGFYLIGSNIRLGIKDLKLWFNVFLRLIVVPGIMLLIFKYIFSISDILLACCILPASAPSAAITTMLASKYDADTALASRLVSITTILSIITIPLMLMICKI